MWWHFACTYRAGIGPQRIVSGQLNELFDMFMNTRLRYSFQKGIVDSLILKSHAFSVMNSGGVNLLDLVDELVCCRGIKHGTETLKGIPWFAGVRWNNHDFAQNVACISQTQVFQDWHHRSSIVKRGLHSVDMPFQHQGTSSVVTDVFEGSVTFFTPRIVLNVRVRCLIINLLVFRGVQCTYIV